MAGIAAIKIGYAIAHHFAQKKPNAHKNAEAPGLMVNGPDVTTE